MTETGTFDRAVALERLAGTDFDLLVIGGGITGAGVALDAASRGLRTALVERHDFASGTSSRSSKMVHGGLRYLQNGDFRLVYQALRERRRLSRNAPHLVSIEPFMIPLMTSDGLVDRRLARTMGAAMWAYDLTGGYRCGKLHRRISRSEALELVPTLPPERVTGAYLYYDGRADDARLTLAIARTAALDHGAVICNRVEVVGLVKGGDGRATGARVRADGQELDISARAVVNATGVWSDDLRALDEGRHPDSLQPAKGVHIAVPRSLVRSRVGFGLAVPGDRRSVFVMPWGDVVYIGTTDTADHGPLDRPVCTAADVAYLLGAVNAGLDVAIDAADIVGTWAGLRPLVKAAAGRTADLSRRHRVTESSSGVVSIGGGKLTTYREMAADAVDAVSRSLGGRRVRSRTVRLPLRGAAGHEAAATGSGLEPATAEHLAGRYGGEATAIHRLLDERPELAAPLVPGLPYLRAEAVHAARHEMATSLDDILSRRTRARLLARDAAAEAAAGVAGLVGDELGWSQGRRHDEAAAFRADVEAERDALASVRG